MRLPSSAARLAGEGQAQHLVRGDAAVGDQPDDPGGHRLGLAGSGTGDHRGRGEAGLDHGGLLVGGGREPECRGELDRGDHEVTCRPFGCRGQLVRTSQSWQRPFSMASNSCPRMRSATWSIARRAHCGSSDSDSGGCCWARAPAPPSCTSRAPPGVSPSSGNAPCSIASW